MPHATADRLRPVYFHTGLQSFVEASGGIFIAGFLVSRGMSYPAALASFAVILLSRFALRGAVLPLAKAAGLRSVVLTGIAIRTISFLILPHVDGIGPLLAVFLLVSGFGSVLYWTGYHAFVSSLCDSSQGGRQVSIQQATAAIVGVVAPIVGGLLLARAGAAIGFGVIAGIQALAAVPLLTAPNPSVPARATLDHKAMHFARTLYLNEGFHAGCSVVLWNLALFASLGEHFDSFGGAIAVAGLAAAAGSVLVGKLIDGGRPQHSLALAYGAAALALVLKGAAYGSPWLAVGATALGALVTPMAATAMLTPLYGMARRSPCVLRFNMATEGGWDLGCSAACLLAAGVLQAGGTFRLPILAGLAAVLTMALMLSRWYGRSQTVQA
ncbi:MFS transporter [Novosphingobium sp.]|uniref:MFS transporter n=1 Tax=Novosphingobium sp. TaxID=1874826 RepID=UPI0038B8791B